MKSLKDFLSEENKITLRDVNHEAGKSGLQLVKGEGYYYWIVKDNNKINPDIFSSLSETSVYIYDVKQLPMSEWKTEIRNIINEYKEIKKERELEGTDYKDHYI